MSDTTIIILAVLATCIIVIAMWRFRHLHVKGKILGAEGELSGDPGHPEIASSQPKAQDPTGHKVETIIKGSVKNSGVYTSGGNVGSSYSSHLSQAPITESANVRTRIEGDVADSDIQTAGKDIG